MCRNRKRNPDNRCENAQPTTPCLDREAKRCPEHAGKHGVSAQPEEGKTSTQLRAVWRYPRLGIALRNIKCRLRPVEAKADQAPVDEAVTHVVELGAQ